MCYHQGSRLRLWQGKRRQSQRKSQNLDPKGKENTALGQNGEAGRGNQFLNKDKKYGVILVKFQMIWGNPRYITRNPKLKCK